MIRICRAEDGEVFQTNATLWDIERLGNLETFLRREIGIDEGAVLAYLSDGRRLRTDNVRDLAGTQDQSIFVFNKYYLDEDFDEVVKLLHLQPPLQPPIEETMTATPPFKPSQLSASYHRAALAHQQSTARTLESLRCQQSALRIASTVLDLNVLNVADVFDGVAAGAHRELEKQANLIASIDSDLEMVSRVQIHREFMSTAMQRAMDAGNRGRTLGDYVSNEKMYQVGDSCRRTHEELRERFHQIEASMKRLSGGAAEVRSSLSDTRLLDEAEALDQLARELHGKVSEVVSGLDNPVVNAEAILPELRQLDISMRRAVSSITELKNTFTEHCLRGLRQISALNNDLVSLPADLTALQSSFRTKNAFPHIQRLHSLIYAYGATLIEVVRRKEFARFFYKRCQVILELMAKLSAAERKRRQVYRGDVHGQLPFDPKGMEDAVPSIDFSPSGGKDADSSYTLERTDVSSLLRVLEDLERYAQSLKDNGVALANVREMRTNLQRLVDKMDALEAGFDRIAERSLLSSSRLALSRRRLSDADDQAFQELAENLRDLEEKKAGSEALFNEERRALKAEVAHLKEQLRISSNEHEQVERLERELHQARAQIESEASARRILEDRHKDLLSNIDRRQQELSDALSEATNQTKAAEVLRQQLTQAREEAEEIRALEDRNSAKIAKLLEDQDETLRNLEQARARGENLEAQIDTMCKERSEMKHALGEASEEKDRLLRAQASEHDRQLRDYVAEADGDRAVLEHQFFELRAEVEDLERQLKEATAKVEMKEVDGVILREELQRLERELEDARQVENVLREDIRAGRASQSEFEHKVEEAERLIAQLLETSIAYRTAHFKAQSVAQAAISHPSITKSIGQLTESHTFPSTTKYGSAIPQDEPFPVDPSDPAGAIEILRSFDHDQFLEAIMKTGSTIRKWQKQCKEYRERAKGKISFRNFAKGDLALFLPTRNSISKPWAAFNVSFPHYFLQATGHLAEQLKSREWIVARITSITERVVDQKDPSSNPYGLGDGVKYYMLEVEDWTQPGTSKRRQASKKALIVAETREDTLVPLSAPPENEVDESFHPTRAPNSRHFPAARSGTNSSIPVAGPSSLSRLLAQATTTSEPAPPPPDPVPILLDTVPSPIRTPSPTPPATSSSPPQSLPANTAAAGRQHTAPHPSSPLRPGSRASRLSTSSRFSAPRLPAFGGAGGGAAKAVPTTAITAPAVLDEPGADALGPILTTAPASADGMGEGMASLLARRRTTSFHVPSSSSPLAAPTPRQSAGPAAAFASLANWGTSFSRRRKAPSESASTPLPEEAAAKQDARSRADDGCAADITTILDGETFGIERASSSRPWWQWLRWWQCPS
ncbi:putative peripheral membrane protein [Russula earlei]|uniref:Peripheral membrane protein n=1 Tax=Russula earlei TaxID=71964 RepID=A0ACC0U7L4_9AGAM|nr:putative peripheral membrane protein [Russula earlei]